ncbi:MAG: tetratricopeptide repeat protein [Opitutus sp.]|nr:tetratricopeptide repeat protein [Opitutus sp.]
MSALVDSGNAPPTNRHAPSRWAALGVCLFLAGIIWTVFGQTIGHDFVSLDDDENVYENLVVAKGLSLRAIGWAFTHAQVSRWVPVSTLAHMVDAQLYGLWPGGHHLTSVLLHTATAILLFLLMRELTAALWRSAFAAALFAIHPLHVEAVAWVSALQYTLSGLFFVLTIWAYLRYVRQPTRGRYGVMLLLFLLVLLSKEILLTLPCVLLLLDFWPLNRIPTVNAKGAPLSPPERWAAFGRLVVEKIPLFALSAGFVLTTFLSRRSFLQPVETFSLPVRIGNAFVSYAVYLRQMLFPSELTPWYPHPGRNLPVGQVLLSLAIVLAISAWAYASRQKRPYLLVGWLWYLGMLVPVIGFIQGGEQAHCDRYTYLSQIGLSIMLAWTAADIFAGWRYRRAFLATAAVAVLLPLVLCAHRQASYWRNSETLWVHTLASTTDNYVAHNNLATWLAQRKRMPEAVGHFQKALRIKPSSAEAQNNVGYALALLGRWPEAIGHYQQALRLKGDFINARMNLGDALLALGKSAEAQAQYDEAARQHPELFKQPAKPARP